MSDQVLTLLKYVFLAVLYLFFLRVLRAVWVELREPKPALPSEERAVAIPATVTAPGPPGGSLPPGPIGVGPAAAGDLTRALSVEAGGELVVTEPLSRRGQRYTVGSETTIGRAPGCAISLPEDTFVSQLHARLFRRDGRLFVEDLGSTNGTFVGAERVTAAVALRPGDQLRVGNTVLECTR